MGSACAVFTNGNCDPCCSSPNALKMKNCGSYNIFFLVPVSCYSTYCAGEYQMIYFIHCCNDDTNNANINNANNSNNNSYNNYYYKNNNSNSNKNNNKNNNNNNRKHNNKNNNNDNHR